MASPQLIPASHEELLYKVLERAYRLLRYEGLTTRSAQARALMLDAVEKYETEKGIKHARDE